MEKLHLRCRRRQRSWQKPNKQAKNKVGLKKRLLLKGKKLVYYIFHFMENRK